MYLKKEYKNISNKIYLLYFIASHYLYYVKRQKAKQYKILATVGQVLNNKTISLAFNTKAPRKKSEMLCRCCTGTLNKRKIRFNLIQISSFIINGKDRNKFLQSIIFILPLKTLKPTIIPKCSV